MATFFHAPNSAVFEMNSNYLVCRYFLNLTHFRNRIPHCLSGWPNWDFVSVFMTKSYSVNAVFPAHIPDLSKNQSTP